MAIQDRPARLTYEDYLQIPEDGWRHEILDGKHHVTSVPYLAHQAVSRRLGDLLSPFIRANRLGWLWATPVKALLSRHDIVEPDLAFVSQKRTGILTEHDIRGVPDLLVDILCKGNRRSHLDLKRVVYERCGVQEHWLVDSDGETVTVYRLDDGRYRKEAKLTAGDRLACPLFPGLDLPVASLFA